MKLKIILGSTRQNRQGEKVANWVMAQLQANSQIKAELLDLRDWPLPFLNEPKPPSALQGNYSTEINQKWSEKITGGEAFIIITPEYNYGYPGVLKNALDSVYPEWRDKSVGFVSYSSGLFGGVRAVEQLKLVTIALHMRPLRETVNIPKVAEQFKENGEVKEEKLNENLSELINQLLKPTSLEPANVGL